MAQVIAVETEPEIAGAKETGERIVTSVRDRDFERLSTCFHPSVICRLLTPSGLLTPLDVSGLTSRFQQWFGDADTFDMQSSEVTLFGDRLHVSYRIRLREDGLRYIVEQHTFSRLEGGTITRFDLLCSGFRPDKSA